MLKLSLNCPKCNNKYIVDANNLFKEKLINKEIMTNRIVIVYLFRCKYCNHSLEIANLFIEETMNN